MLVYTHSCGIKKKKKNQPHPLIIILYIPVNILQQHSVKYSATTMLISAEVLINYIAKWLVVIVVSPVQAVQVVKPSSKLAGCALVS